MAYATVDEYTARNSPSGSVPPADRAAVIAETLESVSRYLDRCMGWAPGMLAPVPEATLTVWPGYGALRVLRLRDAEGRAWALRSWTTVEIIRSDGAVGDAYTAPDTSVAAVSAGLGLPARALRLSSAAKRPRFPGAPGRVDITGTWGWPTVPPPVRDLTVRMARTVLDSYAGGAAAVVNVLESGAHIRATHGWLWRSVEREYSAGRMGRLGVSASSGLRGP